MKAKIRFVFLLVLGVAVGCATAPPEKRSPLPSQVATPTLPPPPPEAKLKELILPQKEEAKKIPEKLYSLYARDSNVQEVLLAFSRESELNLVIDPELDGKVTVDLKRVTLSEALDAILLPLGWSYRIEGNLIKIGKPQLETRLFTLNYIASKRSGRRETYASTGGGLQAHALLGQGTPTTLTGGSRSGYSDLVTVDEMDLWREIQRGLETIVFGSTLEKEGLAETAKPTLTRSDEKGRQLIINKATGVIWVTDYPHKLNQVGAFLEKVEGSSQRQVAIQAKILEVILSDEHKEGINWKVIENLPRSVNLAWGLTDRKGTTGYPGGTEGYLSGTSPGAIPTPGVFKMKPLGGILAIGTLGAEIPISDIIQAISEQGDLKVLSSPTLSTLNNQKAIIRVANQDVFFVAGAVSTQYTVTQIYQPQTIDIGIILDVTPQIAEDGSILMNIHPSITEKTGEKTTPDGRTTFPLLSVRETDTTVRVRDGETIIIAGLMQEKNDETYTGVPGLMSLPVLGSLFRHKAEAKRKSELVIMITPSLQIGQRVEK